MPIYRMNGDSLFVDTSAFLALLDVEEKVHKRAREIWERLVEERVAAYTSDYVRIETWALVRRRLGVEAVWSFRELFLPLFQILSVGEQGFVDATDKWWLARRRRLSLVDITSFDLIRKHQLHFVFAFDKHFQEEGFSVL